ncbi:MAG: helix-turn-helix domain-containing protein [Gammaproteobacteria bacterium]|nr:helix-turn-helix domain-containing protein [Gammaproteobacteria bacterium]
MESYINPAITPRFSLDIPVEPVIYSRIFLEILAEEGIEPARLLQGTDLTVADLADPANLITVTQQIRIYANIASQSKHPAVGLLSGQRFMPHHHGVWGYAMQSAANLGQAIRIFNQYFDVAGPIARQVLQIDGKVARWQSLDVLPIEPARRVGVEEMLSGNFNLCKQLTAGRFKLKTLNLDYPASDVNEYYEELFQCQVLFEQDHIEMIFDASLLNLKLKNADKESQQICEARCRELLDKLGRGVDIVDRVRRIIYENSCDRRDVDSVASTLCMSTRTLRRHLRAANASFREVLNEVQEALALDYLQRTDLSIDEIAFLLGYSESSNFRHAFKQWTGQTPSAYRKLNS